MISPQKFAEDIQFVPTLVDRPQLDLTLLPSHGWTASGALVGLTLVGIVGLGRRRA